MADSIFISGFGGIGGGGTAVLTEFIGGLWTPMTLQALSAAPSFGAILINAAAEKAAMIITIPKTGTLDLFEFRTSTVGQSPSNGLRISFQDLDAVGDPDGTQDQFRNIAGPFTSDTWVTPGLITSDGTDVGVKRSVVAGQRIAVVIEYVTFVASDSVNIALMQASNAPNQNEGVISYPDLFTTVWAKQAATNVLGALKYETDGYIVYTDENPSSILGLFSTSIDSGTTPDEIALIFQLPFTCKCDGCWIRGDLDGDCDIVLYDSNGISVLASFTVVAAERLSTGGGNAWMRWAPVTLTKGLNYRLTVKPTTLTNIVIYEFTVNSAALMAANVGGASWHRSSRTDAGAWTEDTSRRPFMGLHISDIDVAY